MIEVNRNYNEDCRETMKRMPDGFVDLVVTSPPYWGLRDYGVNPLVWDSVNGCVHEWGCDIKRKQSGGCGKTDIGYSKDDSLHFESKTNFCIKCNAWRGSLGLEPTYQLYIKHLMQLFDEARRVLKDGGSCWVDLGDSYTNNSIPGGADPTIGKRNIGNCNYTPTIVKGLKSKCLVGIPERFVIAMTDKGWIRRNTIIWYKPSCMPSSATDRFTVDFEYFYFFAKKPVYYFEQQFEALQGKDERCLAGSYGQDKSILQGESNAGVKRTKRYGDYNGRNKRCVWPINTEPFTGAHYSTFPPALIETPIKACCPKDGLVYDPFMGAGTTALVALRNNRNFIGSELSINNCVMANRRIKQEKNQGKFAFV